MVIRSITWFVTDQEMDEPLLGRAVLEALGLGTQELLAAACDRHQGLVDAADIVTADERNDASVARIISQGIFHSERGISNDAG